MNIVTICNHGDGESLAQHANGEMAINAEHVTKQSDCRRIMRVTCIVVRLESPESSKNFSIQ